MKRAPKRIVMMALLLAATITLAACKEETREQGVAPIAIDTTPAYFQCGDALVQFTVHDAETASMAIANVSYAMKSAIAASGAKYENLGDPETYFWNKGNDATLAIKGREAVQCTRTEKPNPPEKPYRASGNEPGWNAVVENGILTLKTGYGEATVTAPVSADEKDGATRILKAGDITMTMHTQACADDMSGEAFADTVSVTAGGNTYEGCGRSLVRDIEWQLEDMNKAGLIDNTRITVNFGAEGRVYGTSGCNNYTSGYTLEGETLGVNENMAATMRACIAPAIMEQERKYLQTLPEMTKAALDETGALVLSGNGKRLLFRAAQ